MWTQGDVRFLYAPRGAAFALHSPNVFTDPYEQPFDPAYQTEKAIKHLSFHSYLRKTNASAPLSSQSTSYIPPLSDPYYSVTVPCSSGSHPSWPAGICTKCQPSPVTLSRQSYRMVDHVEFAEATLIDGLLGFWRKTGTQRFGYMLGRYEPYDKVPMGVKAVIEAIHEPPQEPLADGVTVGFPWEESERVESLAQSCGLKVVGIVYTDLNADVSTESAKKEGKVIHKRHGNSFFLSSLEVLFSASLQRSYPNASKYSASGKFSSKFVTCVLSGDAEGNIAIEAYQVSDQAMAMVEADMIEASVDPGVMRVKEELPTRYIPDVFFRYKNKYGIEVKESAKPCFPVEYLLVNVSLPSRSSRLNLMNLTGLSWIPDRTESPLHYGPPIQHREPIRRTRTISHARSDEIRRSPQNRSRFARRVR